jgi:hypothetical protein
MAYSDCLGMMVFIFFISFYTILTLLTFQLLPSTHLH